MQAYLRQAVLNRIRDELRRVGRRPVTEKLHEAIVEHSASPFDHIVKEEKLRQYQKALMALSDEQRKAIVARVELGYTYDQIAEVTGLPNANAARIAVRHAVRRLASEINRSE